MNLIYLLENLSAKNVELWVDGDKLCYRAPENVLTPELLAEIKQYKEEIIYLLQKLTDTAKTDPLSHRQKALWFLYQVAPNSAAYNVAYAARVVSNVDIPVLRQAAIALIERHPILRTTYTAEHGELVQTIQENQEVCFSVQEAANGSQDDFQNWLVSESDRPFDLSNGPVLHFNLLIKNTLTEASAAKEVILLITAHHIAVDFWSLELLVNKLRLLYEAIKIGKEIALPPQNLQYKDYVKWENQMLASQQGERLWSYWRDQLAGELPILNLPTDRPRPAVQTYEGDSHSFVFGEKLTHKLLKLAKAEDVTLYTIVLAAFQVLLLRYTNQEDILIGSPMAGRSLTEFESIVGYFANPVVLRAELSGNPTFRELLCRVRSCVSGAVQHQDYPFPLLVERLQPLRDPSRSPLYQVAFAWERFHQSEEQVSLMDSDGLIVESIIPESKGVPCDLTLTIFDVTRPLKGIWKYNTDLFDAGTIEQMAGYFQTLLESIFANPEEQISTLPLLTKTERYYLKSRGNVVCPSNPFIEFRKQDIEQSIPAKFQEQVRKHPHNIAVHTKNYHWTYSELNCRANQVAQTILKEFTFGEERIALLFEHDAPMVAGILGVLQVGKAYVPLDPNYPSDRVVYILEDSRASAVLTNNKNLARAQELTKGIVPLLNIDDISLTGYSNEVKLEISPDTIAYILYTSGSTGQPKGVIQNHRNVLYFIKSYTNNLHINEQDGLTLLSSYSFDAALIDIFATILNGATLYPINIKEEGLTHLSQWLRQHHITIYHSTPTLYRHFISTLSEDEQLTNIRLVVLGGEEVVTTDVDLYKEHFSDECILINGLGATESSFYLQYFINKQTEITRNTVPVGYPVEGTEIFLLNEAGQKTDIFGEIAIKSPYIALGYWHKPNLTQTVFLNDPECDSKRIYRTGDLGRIRPDGSIEFLGRKDFQVKIRGFRIELGEIEAAIAQHPNVRETLVIATEDVPGNKHLVAYVVLTQKLTTDELRHILRRKLPEYMVPSSFVFLDSLPLTPNGKVNRLALPSPQLHRSDKFVAPRTPIEEMLAHIWASVLKVEQVGIHDNFFELGGHSLLATQLISRLPEAFGTSLPLRSLFESPTVAQLSQVILSELQTSSSLTLPATIAPVSSREDIPLSWAQERLWFLHQLEGESAAYTIAFAVRLVGGLSIEALEGALQKIVQRHEVLRTRFEIQDNKPVQIIDSNISITLPVVDIQNVADPWKQVKQLAIKEAYKPFDLAKDPVLRVKMWQVAQQDYVLLIAIHHIAADDWSLGVLNRELSAHYRAIVTDSSPELPELPVQYADFTIWQRRWLTNQVLERQLNYWKEQLAGAPPLLELPTDRLRPAIQTFRGRTEPFQLDSKLTSVLRQISQESGSTLFMTLLAGFVVLMSRYSGQTDLVVGSPIANRNRKEIEGLIGFFVNILALRFDLSKELTFADLLTQVREVTQNAYDHQDLPFEMLVEQLQLERKLNRNPLVQVVFSFQNAPFSPWDLPSLRVEKMPWQLLDAVRFDLELHLWETPEGLEGFCCYSSDLFDAATIARMMKHFQNLLVAIAANPQQSVALLPLLTQQEHHQLLVEWNDTGVDYPQDKCIHQFFEEQVERTPDAVAVVYANQHLTYRELNCRANQLAHHLRSLGVGADVLVGICVERSLLMIVGLLGILKAGGAYVPLDPEYPQERLSFMLEDAQVPVLLTQQQLVESLPKHQVCVVCLDTDFLKIAQNNESNLENTATPDNLAYVIYTSGSTGKPKGVLVNHKNVVRLFAATNSWYNFNAQDVWTMFHSYAFDFSVWEIWGALLYGGKLVVVPYLVTRSPESFYELLCQEKVTILNQTPSAFRQLIQAEQSIATISDLKLRLVIFGGEALELSSLQPWFERHDDQSPQLVNMYGITETTVHVTYRPLSKADLNGTASVIGRPIPDLQVYVLDEYHKLVPVGVPGEMYVGGAGVTRGYLNRPELTQQRFISHPFSNNPQARLYKTGDKARYLPNGELEYLGRIDYQVKIRGFRIELGEIEAVLSQHPLVQESVVVVREDTPGDKRLVAYLVPAVQHKTLPQQVAQWHSEYVSDWQMLYEQAYSQQSASTDDLKFNITGWNSSYTRQPIPAPEMQEWVESTVNRILAGFPKRVLEIGCGIGLLLSRIAKHCQQYWGTDYSIAAIHHVKQICSTVDGLAHVQLLHQMADNFEGIPKAEFDTVILNSVVQYFPSVEYLLQVIEGAMAALTQQGTLFIGDVRSLPLLEPYHASVQLSQAADDRTVDQWQRIVRQSVAVEEELVIAPSFFIALQTRFPQITWVEIQPKRGNSQNELTQFRYDVTLHIGTNVQKTVVSWLNWQLDGLSLAQIQNRLQQEQPELLAIRRVPNQRLQQALQIWQWLENPPSVETVGQLRLLLQQPATSINPEEFWELGQQLGYTVHLSWWESRQDGCYDVVFCRNSSNGQGVMPSLGFAYDFWDSSAFTNKPWTDYSNNFLRGKLVQKLVLQVREYIQQKLPDYMVPQAFVVLNALPLTLNGKVDRRSLPSPDTATRNLSTGFVLPRTPIETKLARLWSQVLGVERIGVNDNFFELGGHSLLATQLLLEINSAFGLNLSIQLMFESPTVAGIADYMKVMNWATQDLPVEEANVEIVEL
jgi:amino acid adenylation domain-containing protein